MRALLSDSRGNTSIIAAAALIPMIGMIGGGVDIGRAYMARTQLQAACDAGVLAGRRAMSKSGSYDDAEKAKANKMFAFNFNADAVNAKDVSYVTVDNDDGQVTGVAKATIPTILMHILGIETTSLNVDCMAELQIANADVMFVLDTTGSMGGSRIAGLRDAVRDFHKTMNGAVKDKDTRIRYGFVPYSMTVNAKELVTSGALPTSYFIDSGDYQTRIAQFNTPVHIGTTVDKGTEIEQYGSAITEDDCDDFGRNRYPKKKSNPETSGSAPGKTTSVTYSYYSWDKSGTTGDGKKKKEVGTCRRTAQTLETTYETKFAFSNWRYIQDEIDTSVFKTMTSVAVGTDMSSAYADQAGYYDVVEMAKKNGSILHNVGTTSYTWNGCLEERSTVDDADWDPIPDDAYDLDLDLEPESEETRWRPMWDNIVFLRNHAQHEDATGNRDSVYAVCPSPMKLFTEVELSDDKDDVPEWLNTYLNGLVATGNTYHDIGMIWGGRLASSRGIFSDNVNEGDSTAVSRHVIFMTDGQMQPYMWGNDAYGLEVFDNRVAPKNSDTATLTARHNARFLAACEAVKAKGMTVWVIAFGTNLTDDLKTCSSSGRAYKSSDTDELKTTFAFIASQVANLRLGQ